MFFCLTLVGLTLFSGKVMQINNMLIVRFFDQITGLISN